MADNRVEVRVGARTSELEQGMNDAEQIVDNAADNIEDTGRNIDFIPDFSSFRSSIDSISQLVTTRFEEVAYAFLRENKNRKEFQILESFFLARRGAFDSFLFKMPDDFEFDCTYVGDGVTTTFQLYKQMHNLQLPIGNTKATSQPTNPLMWNANSSQLMWNANDQTLMWNNSSSQITADGKVVLSTPLGVGQMLNIKGIYYYRCRFKEDEQQYVNFMKKLWKASKVEFIGSLGNKI
ncbi:hypothetical protein ACI8B_210218 [Acinetobacter proteolyticus]|uniref:DUF2460 domain-containing protein n=1 Tax=Acinetobacter proteolyticus TaxID=1776741 RepID=A0A653K3T5_9GAMM|nr:DUF2460 domain-containing protein [Acinetobacter proteolyticus]VXA55428.1 hypothetical protein ACI8B_210218 [Acinetobacter proteolyticus]